MSKSFFSQAAQHENFASKNTYTKTSKSIVAKKKENIASKKDENSYTKNLLKLTILSLNIMFFHKLRLTRFFTEYTI